MNTRSVATLLVGLSVAGVAVVGAGVSAAQETTQPPAPAECTLVLSPDPVPVGAVVSVTVNGIDPGTEVIVSWVNAVEPVYDYANLPPVVADGDGVASVSFLPDPPLVDGSRLSVIATAPTAYCSAVVDVVAAAPPATAAPEAVATAPTLTG